MRASANTRPPKGRPPDPAPWQQQRRRRVERARESGRCQGAPAPAARARASARAPRGARQQAVQCALGFGAAAACTVPLDSPSSGLGGALAKLPGAPRAGEPPACRARLAARPLGPARPRAPQCRGVERGGLGPGPRAELGKYSVRGRPAPAAAPAPGQAAGPREVVRGGVCVQEGRAGAAGAGRAPAPRPRPPRGPSDTLLGAPAPPRPPAPAAHGGPAAAWAGAPLGSRAAAAALALRHSLKFFLPLPLERRRAAGGRAAPRPASAAAGRAGPPPAPAARAAAPGQDGAPRSRPDHLESPDPRNDVPDTLSLSSSAELSFFFMLNRHHAGRVSVQRARPPSALPSAAGSGFRIWALR